MSIRVGDVGTVFVLTIYDDDGNILDISTATSKVFRFKNSTEVVEKTGSFLTDGKDGKVVYVFQNGDIDISGTWKVQAVVTMPGGYWQSSIETFRVEKNLTI